jgi:hypothetical protein
LTLVVKSAQRVNDRKLKTQLRSVLILLVTALFVCSASGGAIDPRFDGRWVGLEKFSYPHYSGTTITIRAPDTVIGIAEHGKVLGVLSGWATGRYEFTPESRGNTVVYRMAGGKQSSTQGREECKLVLSPDGNSIEETGHATLNYSTAHIAHEPTRCQVSGTFHRQGK